MAVVRNMRLPQTMGDECPRPAIGVFHLMFFPGPQVAGRFFSLEIPCPEGPRHCGQLPLAPAAVFKVATATTAITRLMPTRLMSFILSASFGSLILVSARPRAI
jgi:hypothetical protein